MPSKFLDANPSGVRGCGCGCLYVKVCHVKWTDVRLSKKIRIFEALYKVVIFEKFTIRGLFIDLDM